MATRIDLGKIVPQKGVDYFDGQNGQDGTNGTNGVDGQDGVSPSIEINTISGGHQVTIKDATHPQGQSFDVMDGQGGGMSDAPSDGKTYVRKDAEWVEGVEEVELVKSVKDNTLEIADKDNHVAISISGKELRTIAFCGSMKLTQPKLFQTRTRVSIDNLQDADIYTIYDDLCTINAEQIQRGNDIGVDSDNNNIRLYRIRNAHLCEATVEGSDGVINNNVLRKKILLIAGVHGNEKAAVTGLARFVEELVTSDEPWALVLRSNYTIDVIPIVNVWGFNNNSRNNKDDVNINRDYINLSSTEATAIHDYIEDNINDIRIVLDCHNTTGKRCYFEMLPTEKRFYQYEEANAIVYSAVYRNWKTLQGSNTVPYLNIVAGTHTGTLSQYVNSLGLIGHTVEAPRDIEGGSAVNYDDATKLMQDMLANLLSIYSCL